MRAELRVKNLLKRIEQYKETVADLRKELSVAKKNQITDKTEKYIKKLEEEHKRMKELEKSNDILYLEMIKIKEVSSHAIQNYIDNIFKKLKKSA